MRHHARVLVLAVLTLLASSLAFGEDRALLIGVGEYKSPDINTLYGPTVDVDLIHRLLVEELAFPEANIKELKNSQATRGAILEAIRDWLISGTVQGDRVVLYFSGHGAQIQIPDGDSYRLTTGLTPHDADLSMVTAEAPGGLILGSQLGVLIRQMAGRLVTVVVDACHSGSLTRGMEHREAPPNIRTVTPFGPITLRVGDVTDELIAQSKTDVRLLDFNSKDGDALPGVAVWSAATIAQYSWDSGEGGIFTNAFVDGLRQRSAAVGTDERVTASNLLAFVRRRTEEFCVNYPECAARGFTPELLAPEEYRASVIVPYTGTPLEDEPVIDLAEDLLSHKNDFELKAAVLPGAEVSLGDKVRFSIESEVTGRILVLDSGPDGKLRRIFPNEFSLAAGREGLVTGGSRITIPDQSYPFEFTATDPGPGKLLVLVAEPDIDLGPLMREDDFEVVEDAAKALIAVADELQEPVLDPDPDTPNRAHRWAFVTVPYTVSE